MDAISERIGTTLSEFGTNRKDILRIRYMVEEALCFWLSCSHSGTVCHYLCGTRLGRSYIEIQVKEEKKDPGDPADNAETDCLYSSLLSSAGLTPVYSYKNGYNCLTLYPEKKKRFDGTGLVGIAILLAVAAGLLLPLLPSRFVSIVHSICEPLLNAFLGLIGAIAAPMIFLAIASGIIGIGDMNTAGKMGKTIILRMTLFTFLFSLIGAVASCPFFPLSTDGAGEIGGFSQLYNMILDILPSSIVQPFLQGNCLQIIFLGCFVGIVVLMLGDKVNLVSQAVFQCADVVQALMGIIGKGVPAFVFLSVFSLVSSGVFEQIQSIVKALGMSILACVLSIAIYVAVICAKYRLSVSKLIRKLLPTFLIAISTASSPSAFSTNLETCENELGIDKKLVNFAIPFGQVYYMPAGTMNFIIISLCMAESHGVIISKGFVMHKD